MDFALALLCLSPRNLLDNRRGRGARVARAGDGTPDHEIICTGGDRLRWCYGPRLIVDFASLGPDAGRYDQRPAAERLAKRVSLLPRSHHPIATRLLRQHR